MKITSYISPVYLVTLYIRGRAERYKSTVSHQLFGFKKFQYCSASSHNCGKRNLPS